MRAKMIVWINFFAAKANPVSYAKVAKFHLQLAGFRKQNKYRSIWQNLNYNRGFMKPLQDWSNVGLTFVIYTLSQAVYGEKCGGQ